MIIAGMPTVGGPFLAVAGVLESGRQAEDEKVLPRLQVAQNRTDEDRHKGGT